MSANNYNLLSANYKNNVGSIKGGVVRIFNAKPSLKIGDDVRTKEERKAGKGYVKDERKADEPIEIAIDLNTLKADELNRVVIRVFQCLSSSIVGPGQIRTEVEELIAAFHESWEKGEIEKVRATKSPYDKLMHQMILNEMQGKASGDMFVKRGIKPSDAEGQILRQKYRNKHFERLDLQVKAQVKLNESISIIDDDDDL